MAGYAGSAGGGEVARGAVGQRPVGDPPPPALHVGARVVVHLASCESPEQHERVTLAGVVVERYLDGAALAEFTDGSRMELCPWFDSGCANARPASSEAAA
jgi:hypothetical protein